MKTLKKYDYFFKMMAFYAVALFTLYSCVECKKTESTAVFEEKKLEPVLVDKIIDSYSAYRSTPYNGVVVNQSNMRYAIFYVGSTTFTINLTKDSLEVVALKRQVLKDSLQIEVSRKYLKN